MVDTVSSSGLTPSYPEDKKLPIGELQNRDALKADQLQGVIHPAMNPDIKPTVLGGVTSKAKINETGHNPETEQLRDDINKTNQFLTAVLAFFWTALSYLNIFAYFYKKPELSLTAPGEVEKIKAEKMEVSGEQLSQAAQFLISYLAKNEESLNAEGIFRISGRQPVVNQIIDKLMHASSGNQHDEISKVDPQPSSFDVAAALKQLFGQMNLFGSPELKKQFLEVGNELISSGMKPEETIERLKALVGQLSDQQKNDLSAMLDLLGKVEQHKDVNLMTFSNLAIVFGPRLVTIEDPIEILQATKQTNAVAENLIVYRDKIF